jgi:very-short-patch-repair endonuclease
MLAATLACGGGTVVSHRSAAALLRLLDRAPVVIDVIAPKQIGRGIAGVRRHHVPPPIHEEAGHCNSIPCTSPSRTIVDLAGMLGERSLRRVVEQAAVLRVLDIPGIERSLAARRRRGAPMLRSILREWHPTTPHQSASSTATSLVLRSPLEARLLALVAASDLPRPICNHKIAIGSERIEVDFLWSQQRLVVETDGERFHNNPLAFERDRKRDRVLQLRGYRVIHFTHAQIEKEPEAVITTIRRLLEADFG